MKEIKLIGFTQNSNVNNGTLRYIRSIKEMFKDEAHITNIKKYEFTVKNKKILGSTSIRINIKKEKFKQLFIKNKYKITHSLSGYVLTPNSNTVTIHDIDFYTHKYYYNDPLTYSNSMKNIYDIFKNKNVKHIIVPSETTKNEIIKMNNDINLYESEKINITAIHHNIKIEKNIIDNIYNPYVTKNNILISGGLDNKRRKFNLIMDKIIENKINKDHYIYVTGYSWNSVYDKYLKEKNIIFITDLDDIKLYSYMYYCDMSIYQSINEGFGYTPLELLYFNKPLLINDIPVFHETLQNNVLYYKNDFSDFIEEFEKLKSFKNETQKYVKDNFNTELTKKRYMNVYNEIINS